MRTGSADSIPITSRWVFAVAGADSAQLARELANSVRRGADSGSARFQRCRERRALSQSATRRSARSVSAARYGSRGGAYPAAIAASEPIEIHGDYDVDGVTSTVILKKALELAGTDSGWHIPHRLNDGYGMQPAAVEEAARGV